MAVTSCAAEKMVPNHIARNLYQRTNVDGSVTRCQCFVLTHSAICKPRMISNSCRSAYLPAESGKLLLLLVPNRVRSDFLFDCRFFFCILTRFFSCASSGESVIFLWPPQAGKNSFAQAILATNYKIQEHFIETGVRLVQIENNIR